MPLGMGQRAGQSGMQNFISQALSQQGGPTAEQASQAYQMAQQGGFTPDDLAAMSGGRYDANTIRSSMGDLNQMNPNMQQQIPRQVSYGSEQAEGAVYEGMQRGMGSLGAARGDIIQGFGRATKGLQPYVQPGYQANDLQAALSGALGAEAQATAFENYQNSPGQAWLQQQGDRALTRNAAALGGLGGGNVQRELVQFGQGLANQDLQNQFGRLGDVATRGLSSSTTIAGLEGQQAQMLGQLGQAGANMQFGAGRDIGQIRQRAGQDIANAVQNTTSSLSNLVSGQGAGVADIMNQGTVNVNNLIQAAMQGDAAAIQQLGGSLANVNMSGAGQFGGQPITQGQPSNMLGNLGSIAQGAAGMMQYWPKAQTQTTNPAGGSVYNFGNGYGAGPNQSS